MWNKSNLHRPNVANHFWLAVVIITNVTLNICPATAQHIESIEIDSEKAYLVVADGDQVSVEIREYAEFLKIIIDEDGEQISYEIPNEYKTIKVSVKKAKLAAYTYQLGDEQANALLKDRRLIYDGCDGFDTVFINLDYDSGGDTVDTLGFLSVDIVTGSGQDNVNLEVAHFGTKSGLNCNVDLGDDNDTFRFYTEQGSDSETGITAHVDAGDGSDKLFLEYFGQSTFQNGPTEISFDGNLGDDQMRWFSAGHITNSQQIEFFGGGGRDLMLGWIMGECPESDRFQAYFFGEGGTDALGFHIDGNLDWDGFVVLDGGESYDLFYPSEKFNDYKITLIAVENFLLTMMDWF